MQEIILVGEGSYLTVTLEKRKCEPMWSVKSRVYKQGQTTNCSLTVSYTGRLEKGLAL